MNKEKEMILNMLKEGKITVEEAGDLLEAIGADKKRPEDTFVNKFSSSVEKAIKKAGEAFSSIDFDIDLGNFTQGSNFNISKNGIVSQDSTKIEDEISEIDVNLVNGKIEIERSQDPYILVDTSCYFKNKSDEVEDYILVNVEGGKLVIENNDEYKKGDVGVTLNLSLNKAIYDRLKIDLVNGTVAISDVDFLKNEIDGVNCKMEVINSSGDIDIDNTNSKVSLQSVNGNISIASVNGNINLSNVSGDSLKVDSVTGSIRIDGLATKEVGLNTNSGSIKIGQIKEGGTYNLDTGFGNVVVNAEDFAGDIRALVKASSYSAGQRFTNKIQRKNGYEISTNPETWDLDMTVETGFGKVTIK